METALSMRRLGGQIVLTAVGALGMIGGLMIIIGRVPGRESTLAGLVATAGGAALIFLPRLGLRARTPGVVTALLVAAGGSVAGMLRETVVSAQYSYRVGRGYPFPVLSRGDTGDTLGAAKAATLAKDWNFNLLPLLGDLAFWAFAGVLLAVLIALLRKAYRTATA